MNECELKSMLTDLIDGEINISQTINHLKNTVLRHTMPSLIITVNLGMA